MEQGSERRNELDPALPESQNVALPVPEPVGPPIRAGRPSKFTAEMRMALKMAAGYGLRVPQLAAIAGVPLEVFERRLARDKNLRRAIDEGKALAELEVSKTLFDKATAGDINAIKWYEQTRTGRSAKEETHTHNLNFDFTAAVSKFEMLTAKARMLNQKPEPTQGELWLKNEEAVRAEAVRQSEVVVDVQATEEPRV